MNFIAGFFYLIYKDEMTAFIMFCSLMKSMNFTELYRKNSSLFEQYIYQINNFLGLYLPSLHGHFYEMGFNCGYFFSSWFFTSFCYMLQFGNDANIPVFLSAFFDKYLIVNFIKI